MRSISRPHGGLLPLTAVLAALLAPAPASAAGATLSPSADRVTFGDTLRLTGSVEAADPCRSDRAVRLEGREPGEAVWTTLATGDTTADGQFAFELEPPHTSEYRAVLPAAVSPACPQADAPSVAVDVGARVVVAAPATLRASNCAPIPIEVRPPKPGDDVGLERRDGTTWRTVATVALDDASRASVPMCLGWDDLGSIRLRAVWLSQDTLNATGTSAVDDAEVRKPRWMRRIDRLAGGGSIGISVREAGKFLYRRADTIRRIPASNEKLLLSMAVLDRLGSAIRLRTSASAASFSGGVVPGDLWLIGSGDPTLGRGELKRLARDIAEAGVARVQGRVLGSTCCFGRDWFAPGWKRDFPREEVALPTALAFRGNQVEGKHVRDPERRAAAFLTRRLRALGVRVGGRPGAGRHPKGLTEIAGLESRPLSAIAAVVDSYSWNFGAEVLGKLLGQETAGAPGTIAKGAAAAAAWAKAREVRWTARDGSGLSYDNRVSPAGVARLLGIAEAEPWGPSLRAALASPGHGTLARRLSGVRVRAKTGTLESMSSLSGWVWLDRVGAWAEFSILSAGLSKTTAMRIEDAVVRTLARSGG